MAVVAAASAAAAAADAGVPGRLGRQTDRQTDLPDNHGHRDGKTGRQTRCPPPPLMHY